MYFKRISLSLSLSPSLFLSLSPLSVCLSLQTQLSINQKHSKMGAQDPKSLPWNPDSTSFPSRKDLPELPNAPKDAAWVWGENDNVRPPLLCP